MVGGHAGSVSAADGVAHGRRSFCGHGRHARRSCSGPGRPGALGTAPEDVPQITPYLPDRADPRRTAVIVCPGGGYRNLSMENEGSKVAEFLNGLGVTAFVLRYRLGPRYRHPVAARRRAARAALRPGPRRRVRPRARIALGIMGFSAGGHLTATVATHFDRGDADAADPIDRESARPDFAILAYPVITLAESWTAPRLAQHAAGARPAAPRHPAPTCRTSGR